MKNIFFTLILISTNLVVIGQNINSRVATAFQLFEKDNQLVNGIASLYVVEASTGKVVFEKNASIGLAPASTQKLITAATAYELLGKDFRYQTQFGEIVHHNANTGVLFINASGDPTLGSWRWEQTKEQRVLDRITKAFSNTSILQGVVIEQGGWNYETIPGGWTWEDIGNYYGAGPSVLNWRENQFDLHLKSGASLGSPVSIVSTTPKLYNYSLSSDVRSAAKGTGDNAYIYFPLSGASGMVRGTIPVNENRFTISGSMPNPANQFVFTLADAFKNNGKEWQETKVILIDTSISYKKVLHTEVSPPLDSIIYWFNRRSINLYGEALIKTISYQNNSKASTAEGVKLLKEFWKNKGIPATELNIFDGSGLSPLNRVTTKSQVTVLQYAKKQNWYRGFYASIPEFNGMKMKSGTINGVKGFAGYHTSKNGTEYIYSFIVNNYNGSASALVQKMYKVLNELK
jgi:serine-type D-Ala-D-Ala carboxypeptidase/endopeptidase (penicillin-binding protein 4)